jgi:hypothetical protein
MPAIGGGFVEHYVLPWLYPVGLTVARSDAGTAIWRHVCCTCCGGGAQR